MFNEPFLFICFVYSNEVDYFCTFQFIDYKQLFYHTVPIFT